MRGRRGLSGLLAGATGLVAVGLLAPTSSLERLELQTHDLRFRLRGPRPTQARIVIGAIADSTMIAWEEPRILWGPRYAQVIEQAHRAGVTWIGLDFIHSVSGDPYAPAAWSQAGRPLPDQQFAHALAASRRVVLSYLGGIAVAGEGGTRTTAARFTPIPALLFAHEEQPLNLGFVQLRRETDEAIRRGAVYNEEQGNPLPSLVAVLALRTWGSSPADPALVRRLADPRLVKPGTGSMWINYLRLEGEAFPQIPLEQLARGRLTAEQRALLKGAILLIGPTSPADNDLHRAPGGRTLSGVEINAHHLATLVDDRPLQRAARSSEAWVAVGFGLIALVTVLLLPFQSGLALLSGVLLFWIGLAIALFQSDIVLPMVAPVLAAASTWSLVQIVRSVEERGRREHVERVWGRHVAPDVMEALLEEGTLANLGGELREVTVLFADIRGFTTVSDHLSPPEVVEWLNLILGAMAECVQRRHGVVDKYLGDGLMAFWNSPRPCPTHALDAVLAASEMGDAVAAATRRWRETHNYEVRVGVGINTGPVVVGSIGTEKLRQYTVIGSVVNLASRIEGINKTLGTSILLGEATYQAVADYATAVRRMGQIRGQEEPVTVYELVDCRAPDSVQSSGV